MQIHKPSLLQRLASRFGIASEAPTRLVLSRDVHLTSNADEVLAEVKHVTGTVASSGAGNLYILQVPLRKRWKVWKVYTYRATGDRNIDGLRLYSNRSSGSVYFDSFSAGASRLFPVYHSYWPMDEMDQLGVVVTGGTTDGNFTMEAWVTEEDIL